MRRKKAAEAYSSPYSVSKCSFGVDSRRLNRWQKTTTAVFKACDVGLSQAGGDSRYGGKRRRQATA